ncbi:class I SAM-dependent methyltransferase [Zhihengliuella flava]|uniref:SAM-dependent methyltransferase n=1 Tax=Zhihengliuella flava TaxID=1285193 RepID=A0A931DBQ0_9MICC|nr:class I SAM-dependent methyltransferase [Zhihengliuella flava]MBG6085512.1 SAM-dependent methyltransferase [Zhihengliuella flava]
MAEPTRWATETTDGHSQWYIERFRSMAADGADLVGEARLIDAMVPRAARILDAGCGPGRHAGYLHACGHDVVGIDADPELIAAAREDHAGPEYAVLDLVELELAALGREEPFDAVLMAGNVMVFLAPGTEVEVLRRVAACLSAAGFVAVGFHTDRHLALADFDAYAEEAGLRLEHRFSTWELGPWYDDADFAVSILRHA